MSNFTTRTNIFGNITSSAGAVTPPFSTTETNPAAKLIAKLQWLAETNIEKLVDAVDWLGLAANQGQNNKDNGLIVYQNEKPEALTSENILSGWTSPAMPSLPAFPTLPSFLDIDINSFKTGADNLVNALQNSWLSHFLPATTDTSRYDVLFNDILNGTDEATAKARLDAIFNEMNNNITSNFLTTINELNLAIATLRTDITTRKTGLPAKVQAALDAAVTNSDIAFARARDQVARESARLEAEAVAEWAARGFAMPSGVLAAQQAAQRQATLDAATKVAAEEAIKAMDRSLEIAKMDIDAWMRMTDFEFRADVEAMRQPVEARLRYAEMQLTADREKAEVAFKHLGLRMDFTKFSGDFALKYRTMAVEGMNGLINAYANLTRNEADYYVRIADAKRQAMMALVEYHKLALSQAKIGMDVSLANTENDLKWTSIAADFIAKSVFHHVTAAVHVADSYGKIAGGALSGLNGVAAQTSTSA